MGNTEDNELEGFIAGHIDEALEKGWIKVYFQPVVRALTGKLSSCEALTRWVDPEHGMISPGVFIPVLEKTDQIQKVDLYVIDHVAKLLKEIGERGELQIPVSFNLSRVDFSQTDPYEEIEKAVAKYGVDRKFFKVEITESTLISDPQKLQNMFTRFHNNGYDIWMDDFGSGYSTLNVLKDYSFDEIKIDMLFLRGLNQRGRNIVSSIVRMAKSLDIHTLTEGAETREQVDFLREIGCEKIQGYYYGAPMPYEKLVQHCMDFGLFPETEDEAVVYDAAGSVDFLADKPLALIDSVDGNLKLLFNNKGSREVLKSLGAPDGEEFINDVFELKNTGFYHRFSDFLKKVEKSDKEEMINAVYNGRYYRIYTTLVKRVNRHSLFTVSAYDITYDLSQKGMKRFNDLLREANQIYNHIYLWSPKDDKLEVVESEDTGEKTGDTYTRVKNTFRQMAEQRLASDDRERFMTFMSATHIKAALARTHNSFTGDCFKVKKPEGGFAWDEIDVMSLRYGGYGEYLILERRAALDEVENTADVIRRIDASDDTATDENGYSYNADRDLVYRSIMEQSGLKYFWKDTKRRFLGVSRAFLGFYGIGSASEIIGKTDEEMGWHVDNAPYMDDEKKVLREGRIIRNSLGHTLAGGKIHIISATKFPIYKGDTIVGLAGYFKEVDTLKGEGNSAIMTDTVTGFMNFSGFMASVIFYHDNYKRTGEGYTLAYIRVDNDDSGHRFDSETAKIKLERRVSDAVSDKFVTNEMICSMEDRQSFMILTKESTGKVRDHVDALSRAVSEIRFVGSIPVKLSISYSIVRSEEDVASDQLISVLKERCRIQDIEFVGADRIQLELEKLNDMDERIYVTEADTNTLLYMNRTAMKDLGLPDSYKVVGKKCYEVIHNYDHPCDHCSTPLCSRDGFYSHHYHNALTGQDYLMRDTLTEFAGKKAKLSMNISLTENMKEVIETNQILHKIVRVNDFVGGALEEKNPDDGLNRMLMNICKEFDADRAYIFEENGIYIDNTYEWFAPGLEPQKDSLQSVPISKVADFYTESLKNSSMIIENVEDDHGTVLYGVLKSRKIHSLVATPIKEKGEIIGFIGINNPSKDALKDADATLHILARFISALIRNRNVLRALDDMGQRDNLTGALNRRALKHVFRQMDPKAVVAVIYADVNGLKKVNDEQGHQAGDELIQKAANAMGVVAGGDRVFRMGGDEFVILFEVKWINEIDGKLAELRKQFDKDDISVALGAAARTDGEDSLDKLLKEADERMYQNKKVMHTALQS